MAYHIIRVYENGKTRTIKRGLTLEDAQKHCRDPETTSKTATNTAAKRITKRNGPWFDAYEETV